MTSVPLTSPGQSSCHRSLLFQAQRLLQVLQLPPSPNSRRRLQRPFCSTPESPLNFSQALTPHLPSRPSAVPGTSTKHARHSEHLSSLSSHTGHGADHLHSSQQPALPGLPWSQARLRPLGFRRLESEAPWALWQALSAGGKLFILLSNGRGLHTALQAWAQPQALQASLAPCKRPGRRTFDSSLSQPTQGACLHRGQVSSSSTSSGSDSAHTQEVPWGRKGH